MDGSWAMASDTEHVLQTVQRLLYTRPGSDIYNPELGLDALGRRQAKYKEGDRDLEFENAISTQCSLYTDIVPIAVVCVYKDNALTLAMTVSYSSAEFRLQLSIDPNQLSSLITRV